MSRRKQAYIGEQLTIAALGLGFAAVMIFNPFGWRDSATSSLTDWYVNRIETSISEATVQPAPTVAPAPSVMAP